MRRLTLAVVLACVLSGGVAQAGEIPSTGATTPQPPGTSLTTGEIPSTGATVTQASSTLLEIFLMINDTVR